MGLMFPFPDCSKGLARAVWLHFDGLASAPECLTRVRREKEPRKITMKNGLTVVLFTKNVRGVDI